MVVEADSRSRIDVESVRGPHESLPIAHNNKRNKPKKNRRPQDLPRHVYPQQQDADTTAALVGFSSFQPYRHKWLFTFFIIVLGAAASAALLAVGILGAQTDSTHEFEREAEELVHAIDLSWKNYEMMGLW